MMKPLIRFFLIISALLALTNCSDTASLQPVDVNASILAFGDSLTYGSGTSHNKAYPAVLENLIQRKVINAGIPGEISKQGLQRLPGLLRQYQPALIIICHGANDILRQLDITQAKNNIQQMIDIAHQNNVQVVLIGVPEFSLWLSTSPIYQQLADENKLPVQNNILANIIGKNSLKADRVHPNAKGYQLLAESIATLLRSSGAISDN